MEELQPRPVHLAWDRSHGEPMETLTFPVHSADPPAPGGVGVNSAGATAAADGGVSSGFTLSRAESPSLWELLTDTAEEVPICSPTTTLLDQLEENPRFRRGQVAGALAELRAALLRVSHTANGSESVSLQAGTVVVIAHTLLRHQP